jgi:hypothetical protein
MLPFINFKRPNKNFSGGKEGVYYWKIMQKMQDSIIFVFLAGIVILILAIVVDSIHI